MGSILSRLGKYTLWKPWQCHLEQSSISRMQMKGAGSPEEGFVNLLGNLWLKPAQYIHFFRPANRISLSCLEALQNQGIECSRLVLNTSGRITQKLVLTSPLQQHHPSSRSCEPRARNFLDSPFHYGLYLE